MSKCHTTHYYGCDCVMEKLNNQEQALKDIWEIVDILYDKCSDKLNNPLPTDIEEMIDRLVDIYEILKLFEFQRKENATS